MAGHSRRDVLGCLTGLVAATAGCSSASDSRRESTRPTERMLPNGTESPPVRSLRNPTGDAAVRSTAVTPVSDVGKWTPGHWLVTSDDDRRALVFAPEAEGVAEVEAFLARTDFAAETVLVFQRTVPACLTRTVEEVRWDDDGVSLRWDTEERGTACDSNAPDDVEALFVRIPGAVTELDYFGSGT